ncbi:MAG: DUF3810 domain-containing protein [Clostridiales bacterium]|nr:DUF3810 domain-containing protein [Clostridiales bacterium]
MSSFFRRNTKVAPDPETLCENSGSEKTGSERSGKMPAWIGKWGIGLILPLVLLASFALLQKFLMQFRGTGEYYSCKIFPIVSFLPVKLSSLVPVSLTEIFVVTLVLSSPVLLALFIIRIRRAVKEKRGKKFFFRVGRFTAWMLFTIYALFMLLHGLNYTRRPLEESLGFGRRAYTVEELKEVYIWVVDGLNVSRLESCEDARGVISYPGGVEKFLSDMETLYEESAEDLAPIIGNAGRPKRVALSHYWSYTYIVGMYFPFFGEPNINVDVEMSEILFNAAHEMSHMHGFAVENDANLAAMLICINSDCPELRYTGFCEALDLIFVELMYAFNTDTKGFEEFVVRHPIVDGYFRDDDARSAYWEKIDPPQIVSDASEAANDTFLKANQQEEGVQSYNMPRSNIADYYFTHVKGK